MKVALITPSVFTCPPQRGYGMEMFLSDLASALAKRVDLTLIAPKGSKPPEGGELIETVEAPGRFNGEEEEAYKAYKPRLRDFDVIHDVSHKKWSYMAKLEQPELKVLGAVQGVQTWPAPPPISKPNITCLSEAHARDMASRYGLNCEVIPNGVDLKRFPYHAKKGNRLLCLSLMAPQKGHMLAVCLAKVMGFPLDVAGEDEFVPNPAYVEYVKAICEGPAKYLGRVDSELKLRLMQRARALILPFLGFEVDSLIAKEAAACGTPVITFKAGAMPEIVEHGRSGFVCKCLEGGDSLQEAVEDIDSIKPRDCRNSATRFSMSKTADAYIKAYERVLAGDEW